MSQRQNTEIDSYFRGLQNHRSRLQLLATSQLCLHFHDRLCLHFSKYSQASCGWDQITAPLPSPVKFQSLFEKGHCFPGMPGLVQERKSSFQQEFGACLRGPASLLGENRQFIQVLNSYNPPLLSYSQLLSFMTNVFFSFKSYGCVCV